jgi:spermidine synthase
MTVKTEWTTDAFGHVYKGRSLYKGRTSFQTMELFESETFGTLISSMARSRSRMGT